MSKELPQLRQDYPKLRFDERLTNPTDCPAEALHQIKLDVPRSFLGDNAYYAATENMEDSPLFKILVAYAKIDHEIGYT